MSDRDLPVIVAVDDDPVRLQRLTATLDERYGRHYRIIAEPSPAAATTRLTELRSRGSQVAMVVADIHADGATFLAGVRDQAPTAQRVLLDDWGNFANNEVIVRSSILGEFDSFTYRPFSVADEPFHAAISEVLARWAREHERWGAAMTLIGDPWDAETARLRDTFARMGLPAAFEDAASPEGRRMLAGASLDDGLLPVVTFADGRAVVRPTPSAIADVLGAPPSPAEVVDVTILGAGPAGLAAAVYAASEGLRAVVVEPFSVGGQASSSPMVRNYLGFPAGVTGVELAARAFQQAWTFGAQFLIGRTATAVAAAADHLVVTLDDGAVVRSGTVIIATGVAYRRMGIERLEALVGRGVFYGSGTSEARAVAGGTVYVVGGANSAGSAAIHLARHAAQVTLLVRGDSLTATMSDYLIQELSTTPNIEVRLGCEIADVEGEHRLTGLVLRDRATGRTETVPAMAVFLLIGAAPHTAWLPEAVARDKHGFVLTGDQRPTPDDGWTMATTMPGVFAVGDVRSSPVKRVAAAVGDGSTAVRQIHEYRAALERRAGERRAGAAATRVP